MLKDTTHICQTCGTTFGHKYYGKNMYCSYKCRGEASRVTDHVANFWSKVRKSDGCWEWTASTGTHGYGVFWDGKLYTAHRYSWKLAHESDAGELHVLHHCDNRKCVNPDHLFIGTNNDNIADRIAKGRPNGGGARGSSHGSAKLTDEQVLEIRRLRRSGIRYKVLGEMFHVSNVTVGKIVTGKAWTHLDL